MKLNVEISQDQIKWITEEIQIETLMDEKTLPDYFVKKVTFFNSNLAIGEKYIEIPYIEVFIALKKFFVKDKENVDIQKEFSLIELDSLETPDRRNLYDLKILRILSTTDIGFTTQAFLRQLVKELFIDREEILL
ncbi:hypothetical protein A5816_002911 [Enterococcus sp. 3G1_DIV0629]|uniref:hypothetical protein n=1 Tax=Enterococcus sp. (strain 3G1_DIV0629) TaxID=1834176 RepID=UPI000A331A3A|nr:hypothetical protein [Enterococcus sp. 3G1_DIV0629]EME7220772.1 hypothetical protein [Enterococcus faecium]OTO22239.1 hypothetical protein A5816_002911 [Enterococcus sp. 3G1_DIV0629]